jgi:serine/threonine protein kinase
VMINKGYLLGERYRIIDTLGEGGMANVYLAEDIILQRKVAVKILRLDLQKQPQTQARFQREALATSELSHPNIVSVLDVGTDQGLPYMVMEYVDGPDLKEYIQKNSPLALSEVVRIMDQLLSAMTLAHQHNVIHRDLKPQNILMDKDGNIKIADFGIAVALNQSSITQTNSVMGSVHYMSPEQTRGGMVTKQSDIYSLGIILYELITGKVPFNGETPVVIALKHAQEPIPSIRKSNIQVPQALENVVLKATAKDPRDRYASVQKMKQDLDSAFDPSRANEPVFVPSHQPNNDETIVLPSFNRNTNPEKAVAAEKAAAPKKPKGFLANFKKHKWWWLLTAIFAVLIVLFMGLALSKRGQVQVPDVTNMSEEMAKTTIRNSGLKVGLVMRRHSSSIKAGNVISTEPGANSSQAKGSRVDIIVSNGHSMTKVPDVTGKMYRQAEAELKAKGFKVEQVKQTSTYRPGTVIAQSITPGSKVKAAETTIILIVARKPKQPNQKQITLRSLRNYSLKSAQDYAHDHGLILQISEKYSETVEKGLIISQTPKAGSKVNRGATITVVVSRGPKEDRSSNVTKSFNVNYEEADAHSHKGNHVQIYIQDDDHSLDNIYRDLYIKRDTSFSIPFSLRHGSGNLRVVRDGETILNERVSK